MEYEEEREIKTLEKQLHMNKRKTKALPKAFIADGLDYILDCIDPEKSETVKEQEKNDVWVSELDIGEDGEQSDQEEVVVGGSEDELSDDDEDDLSEDEDEEGEEDMTDGDTSVCISTYVTCLFLYFWTVNIFSNHKPESIISA